MNRFNQKVQKLRSFRYSKVKEGYASNIDDFIDQVIISQFDHKDAIKQMHSEILDYVNSDAPVFFIRAYGSYASDKYDLLRRGFLSKYINGIEYAFCDNTFALLFTTMKLSGVYFTSAEVLDYFKSRKVICGFLETSLERELVSFSRDGALRSNLNTNKWYLAHLNSVGANYKGFTFSKSRDLYFPSGQRSQWFNESKIRMIDRVPTLQELALLKAHFIRLIHPLNNFVVPNGSCLQYNGGTRIGEEPELIYKVGLRLKVLFEKEYAEMEAEIFTQELPLLTKPPISEIRWGGKPLDIPLKDVIIPPKAQLKSVQIKNLEKKSSNVPNVRSLLASMGMEAFLNYFLALKSGQEVDEKKLVHDFPNSRNWITRSNRLSMGKRIFRHGLQKEALEIIMRSKRLRPELIRQAEIFYDILINEMPEEDCNEPYKAMNCSKKEEIRSGL